MESIRDIKKSDFWKQNSNFEKIKLILQYAILAPSIYNSQPWIFKVEESKCSIYLNPDIKIPETDPELRSLYISIGCAIENIVLASKYFGVFERIENISNEGKYSHAEVFFNLQNKSLELNGTDQIDKDYEKLVDFMSLRQNPKGSFKNDPIPSDILSRFSMFALLDEFAGLRIDFLTNKDQISSIGKLIELSTLARFKNKSYRKEFSQWISNSHSRKDGLRKDNLGLSFFMSTIGYHFVSFLNLGKSFAKKDADSFKSAPVVAVLGVDEERQRGIVGSPDVKVSLKEELWLKVGRFTERLLLEFAARGIGVSIFESAISQDDFYKEIQKAIGMTERPELVFCIGYIGRHPRYSERQEVVSKIKTN